MSGTDPPGRLPALGATLLRSLRTVARRGRSGPMPPPRRFLEPRLDLAEVARYRALLGFTAAAADGAGAAPLTWFYLLAQRAFKNISAVHCAACNAASSPVAW